MLLMRKITRLLFIIAWICTLAGDYFLSITQTRLTLGIGLFCIVQTMYMLYLFLCPAGRNFLSDKKPTHSEPAVRIAVFVFLLIILYVMNMLTLQNALAVLDISLLGCNMFKAWRQGKEMLLFAVGLSLFFCCDICVGLRSILPQEMSPLMFVLIWAFYLPSQILIVIYGIKAAFLAPGRFQCHNI